MQLRAFCSIGRLRCYLRRVVETVCEMLGRVAEDAIELDSRGRPMKELDEDDCLHRKVFWLVAAHRIQYRTKSKHEQHYWKSRRVGNFGENFV